MVTVPGAMSVISRSCPAYTNDGDFNVYPASNANDADYSSIWRSGNTPSSGSPIYLAYDLSGVSSLGKVVLFWDNPSCGDYDFTFNSDPVYNLAQNYTIQANTAAGGSYPVSGWTTLTTVTSNNYHSRQHILDLTGYKWVQFVCTAIQGATFNMGVSCNMDVQSLPGGKITDSWIFYGDSITAAGCNPDNAYGVGTIAQLINASVSNFPLMENGGIGGRTSQDGANNIATWLALFPGNFVGLNYGTNDADESVPTSTFTANMTTMVEAVIAANCTPVIPHIPWGAATAIQVNAPAMNSAIDTLCTTYPSIIKGPDLWTLFEANPSFISSDNVHPTSTGYAAYRQWWAEALIANTYTAPTTKQHTVYQHKRFGNIY